jgi:Flp pilus assembly protein TadG
MTPVGAQALPLLRRLKACESGAALVEMAFGLPILLTLTAGGTELARYATVQMRVSQLAIQVADNASRMGTGQPLAAKQITETMINDVLSGAEAQAGELNLMGSQSETVNGVTTTAQKARIIISDLEPIANPNTTNKFKIVWQRCRGTATSYTPRYGTAGQTNLNGMGPTGRVVTAPDGTALMFVEVHYRYQPLFIGSLGVVNYVDIDSVASMLVRDDRDLTQIYNTEGATVASC